MNAESPEAAFQIFIVQRQDDLIFAKTVVSEWYRISFLLEFQSRIIRFQFAFKPEDPTTSRGWLSEMCRVWRQINEFNSKFLAFDLVFS